MARNRRPGKAETRRWWKTGVEVEERWKDDMGSGWTDN
jgi:hypothetical protein